VRVEKGEQRVEHARVKIVKGRWGERSSTESIRSRTPRTRTAPLRLSQLGAVQGLASTFTSRPLAAARLRARVIMGST